MRRFKETHSMACDNCGTCEACGRSGATENNDHHTGKHLEHGFKKFWRPIAAYVYLIICIFDFMGAPLYIAYQNEQVNSEAFAEIRTLTDKDVKLKALEQLDLGSKSWEPLTLQGGAFFHLSFGAILGISAFTRGQEKKASIEKG
jgi:hypothetical protein